MKEDVACLNVSILSKYCRVTLWRSLCDWRDLSQYSNEANCHMGHPEMQIGNPGLLTVLTVVDQGVYLNTLQCTNAAPSELRA